MSSTVNPSVHDKTKYYFCFTPRQAHEYLEIDGGRLCEYKSNSQNIYIGGIYKGFVNGKAQFYECDTPEQIKYYPNIRLKKNSGTSKQRFPPPARDCSGAAGVAERSGAMER